MNRITVTRVMCALLFLGISIAVPEGAKSQVPRTVVLEFCTGTWCQWCPCGDQTAEALLTTYPNLIVLAYHGGSTDPWQNFNGYAVRSMLGFSGYPTAIIDRRNHPGNGSSFPYVTYTQWSGLVTQRYANWPTSNVSIEVSSHLYNATSRQLDVSIAATALQNLNGQYKVSFILTEDSLIYSQVGNATCGYPPSNYVHKWTVRSMVNGPSGENLNSGPWMQNQSIPKTFTVTLDVAWTPQHCRYAILVYRDSTSSLYFSEITQAIQRSVVGPTGVEPVSRSVPEEFSLSQNYPNPFNPNTRIVYGVPSRELVSLKVYDVLGREVATLVNEVREPGRYTVRFDGSRLASGVYLYRLQAGDFVDVKKLILIQ